MKLVIQFSVVKNEIASLATLAFQICHYATGIKFFRIYDIKI